MDNEHADLMTKTVVFSLAQIESICHEFECKWLPDLPSEFDHYLSQVSDEASPILLRNLLQIELRLRMQAGQDVGKQKYLSLLPAYSDLINEEFAVHRSTIVGSMIEDTAVNRRPVQKELPLPKVSRLGDYILERELGRGAMGIVFAARHVHRGNHVALKTLPTTGGAELQRFKQEFRALTNINHPNLVGLHTLQADAGQWFFTMDVVEGQEFLNYVRPAEVLDQTRLRHAFSQLVTGVHALHANQILHRDLKPSNVMVTDEGQVRLLDFGLVVNLSMVESDAKSEIAGTPAYMAPEQFVGVTTPASDWYAVGVMLYQALSGNLPFRGTVNDIFQKKQTGSPPPLPPDAPKDLSGLCQKLLSLHAQHRPDARAVFAVACPNVPTLRDSLSFEGDSDQLMGRDRQVAQIDQAIRAFDEQTSPQTLFISGKSGEGKSVLAEHFLRRFRADSSRIVLAGRCYDRESVPFKAVDTLIDALCNRLLSMSEQRVEKLLTPDVAILAELFPVLTRVGAIARLQKIHLEDMAPQRVRQLAANSLQALLSRLGRDASLICFIDDLQWGDRNSAELLFNVLCRPDGPHVLLIGTYRSDEADSSSFLQAWKSATEDYALTHTQCEVGPLTPMECIELVVEIVGIDNETVRTHAAKLAEESAGNPLILFELASYYDPVAADSRLLNIEDLLERKLSMLPPDARALLQMVSVSGQALSLEEASGSVGHAVVPFATLTRMRNERLVRLVGDEQQLAIDTYHDRIRELVLRDMDAGNRKVLHVRLARQIEESCENVVAGQEGADRMSQRVYDLAYHFYEGGDEKAFAYQHKAGEASMRAFALDNAIDHFKRAEEVMPENAAQESRYRLYERQGEAYGRAQRLEEAKQSLRSAVPNASTSEQRAVAIDGLGDKFQRQGNFEQALVFYYKALEELGYRCPQHWLTVLFETMWYSLWIHIPWLIPAHKTNESKDRAELASHLFHQIAHVMLMTGDMLRYTHGCMRQMFTAVRSQRLDAISVGYSKIGFNYAAFSLSIPAGWFLKAARRTAKRSEDALTRALVDLHTSMSYYLLGRLKESEAGLHAALRDIERQGDSWLRMAGHHHLRHLYCVRGHSEKEIAHAEIEKEISETNADPLTVSWAEFGLANAKARLGHLSEARHHISRAIVAIEDLPTHRFTHAILPNHHAFVLLQSSDYERAVIALGQSERLIVGNFLYMDYTLRTYPMLIEALVGPNWVNPSQNDSVRRATRLSIRNRMFGWQFPNLQPYAQRAHGRLLCATGRRSTAIRYFEKSIRSSRRLGAEYDEARALLDLSALDNVRRDQLRAEAVTILKRLKAVIPNAEKWQLGEDPDSSCIAPMFESSRSLDVEKLTVPLQGNPVNYN